MGLTRSSKLTGQQVALNIMRKIFRHQKSLLLILLPDGGATVSSLLDVGEIIGKGVEDSGNM